MTIEVFRKKLKELHQKSGMDEFMIWPFVYDEDEEGFVYINTEGRFFFADKVSNWVESTLTLDDLVNLRFAKAFEDPWFEVEDKEMEPYESYIYLHFVGGETIMIFNRHETCSIEVEVRLVLNTENESSVKKLKESCDLRPDLKMFIKNM